MKRIVISTLFLLPILVAAQDLVIYTDTVTNFSIGIPRGWTYGTLKNAPSIKIFARQANPDTIDHLFANYNLNIFKTHDSSFNDAYTTFIKGLANTDNFMLIDSGHTKIHDVDYRWILENHENTNRASLIMANYVFMTYKNGTIYILTMVVPKNRYAMLKTLFDRIAATLRI